MRVLRIQRGEERKRSKSHEFLLGLVSDQALVDRPAGGKKEEGREKGNNAARPIVFLADVAPPSKLAHPARKRGEGKGGEGKEREKKKTWVPATLTVNSISPA